MFSKFVLNLRATLVSFFLENLKGQIDKQSFNRLLIDLSTYSFLSPVKAIVRSFNIMNSAIAKM